jgi:hypothetical protein
MKAAWYNNFGKADEVLEIGDLEKPEPGRGEVLVRLHASFPTVTAPASSKTWGPAFRLPASESACGFTKPSTVAALGRLPNMSVYLPIGRQGYRIMWIIRSVPALAFQP